MRHTNGAYYDWAAPGLPFSIHVSLELIDRIESEIRASARVEVGGVLFGRLDPKGTVLHIDACQPVLCDHDRGPSWRLRAADRRRLERTLRKGPVAGYYRSHLRPGLYLDQDDYSLIEGYFANPHDVFLLVRPGNAQPATAGFFFWEEDSIRRHKTYLEFPFRTSELRATTPAVERPPARSVGAGRAATVAAALALLGVWAVERPVPHLGTSALAAGLDSAPDLRVERNGSYLEVGWDPAAAAVTRAPSGLLRITDGTIHKDMHLDHAQLLSGMVAYLPAGNEVTFELRLAGSRKTVRETFRLQQGSRQTQPVVRAEASRPKVLGSRSAQPSGSGM